MSRKGTLSRAEYHKRDYLKHGERRREYKKRYRETNKERIQQQKKEYYAANKERINQQRRERYEADKEHLLQQKKEYDRQYFQTNKERLDQQRREYYEANKEDVLRYHREYYKKADKTPIRNRQRQNNRRRIFNLSPEEWQALFDSQGGKCAICGTPESSRALAVDHCHKTDKVRGLLCGKCNAGIGLLGDDFEGLQKALNYLHTFETSLNLVSK